MPYVVQNDDEKLEKPSASAAVMLSLLTHRLINLRQCITRIDGIKRYLAEKLEVSVVLPTPSCQEVQDAIAAVQELKSQCSPPSEQRH